MRSPALILAILGIGAFVLADRSGARGRVLTQEAMTSTLRDRAIEAQRASARASQLARDLAAQWSAMEQQS